MFALTLLIAGAAPPDPPPVVHLEPTIRAGVYRVCDENGCRLVRGFPNPPAVVPQDFPMPMPSEVMAAPRVQPVRNFVTWFDSHRPRLLGRFFSVWRR